MRGLAAAVFVMNSGASASESYDCNFFVIDHFAAVQLVKSADGAWNVLDETGARSVFEDVSTAQGNAVSLISRDFDSDADAVAMMTVDRSGTSFLSVHGYFPGFDAATYSGTCKRQSE